MQNNTKKLALRALLGASLLSGISFDAGAVVLNASSKMVQGQVKAFIEYRADNRVVNPTWLGINENKQEIKQ
jgi:uncharacterized membrane protein